MGQNISLGEDPFGDHRYFNALVCQYRRCEYMKDNSRQLCKSVHHILWCVIRDDFVDRGLLVWGNHNTWRFGFVQDLPVRGTEISISDISVVC